MHNNYIKFIQIDDKPEKGERKIADDLVLLINDILKPLNPSTNLKIDEVLLYRVGLLEYALELSPYNFDIQLQLMKIYDMLG